MHAGMRCITPEWSWQTVLVSPGFSFLFKFCDSGRYWSPCWAEDGCDSGAALRFLPALQTHPGRVLVNRQYLLWPPTKVNCIYLILLFDFLISVSFCPSCGWILFILYPSFVFILAYMRDTPPYFQFRLISYMISPATKDRRGSSLGIQINCFQQEITKESLERENMKL